MRTPSLLIAALLLAACSREAPPPQAPAPVKKADFAAAEAKKPEQPKQEQQGSDPCDLRGFDMSKMTVDQHEELVKACQKSKQ